MNNNEKEIKNKIPQGSTVTEDIFEPVLGEIVTDDAFAFTLLSCHCNGGPVTTR